MKLITAIIKPEQADNVKKALNKIGVVGLTMTDVKGYGRQKGHTEFYRGSEYEVAFLPAISFDICHRQPDNADFVKSYLNIICLLRLYDRSD